MIFQITLIDCARSGKKPTANAILKSNFKGSRRGIGKCQWRNEPIQGAYCAQRMSRPC
jgi:hypothetical protein